MVMAPLCVFLLLLTGVFALMLKSDAGKTKSANNLLQFIRLYIVLKHMWISNDIVFSMQ